ncbi:MAG: 5-dehydro-2-deoxygluconokinase [Firmicutes bacterium]|nr:5-dehydro-2-deoxygluconokinase [Bacillota bacterium]
MLDNKNSKYDLICLGRLGIDLNCNDYHCELHEVKSFSPTVGGSPANIAIGAAKLGAKVGFIGRVSDDKLGTFILNKLDQYGVDSSQVARDESGAKNCLAITEIMSPLKSGSILYRDMVADLNLTFEDIDERYIADSRILLVSGTALAKSPSREAAFIAAYYAKRHGVAIAFDLDYRPYTWNCPKESSLYYTMFCEKADIIVGTSDEFRVMQNIWDDTSNNDEFIANTLIEKGASLVIVKYGADGSMAWTKDGEKIQGGIYAADLKKTFGAGDAFAAGLLTGLTHGKTLKTAMAEGAAAASIVVSRYSCSESSPTAAELEEFMRTHEMEMKEVKHA